ncbi:hypothetical protein Plec18167_008826 [Paecilomyces lecythidis]|uniref:Geranylgeranyl pyrophosphate synthetase n=1 Tax=Paecilomyces lecythidis TaxID=3004212 RepID=A0ABR3WTU4_9EURO
MASIKIANISRPNSECLGTTAASITDVKQLSAYNWIEASVPTIAVPGSPSLWSPPKGPKKVAKDSGLVYVAQNAARHPESPLEPLFRSLYVMNPSFDIHSVDLVTDRNNIRKLLSFINPNLNRNGLEPFTINVEFINNTAIFCRTETQVSQFIGPHEFMGFGHEFEKAYTTNQVDGSTGHHGVISYRFNDLKLIVRYETDGYVDKTSKTSTRSVEREKDTLSSMLESLSLAPSKNAFYTASPKSKLMIKEEGKMIPIESTLEIKTRVSHKPIDIQEAIPQLWVSQTPNFVRAYHKGGLFRTPEVEDVTLEIKRWEEDHQVELRKLAALIKNIIHVVKGNGGSAIIKYDNQVDKLVILKGDGRKMLPDDLYSKLDDRKSGKEEE